MAVKPIRFSPPVNASEVTATAKCKTALEALGDSAPWIEFAGLASSSSPLHQSDDLDLVLIGPRGVFVIEVKHWDASWINNNKTSAEGEAEKLTAKAKRFSSRVRRALTDTPRKRSERAGQFGDKGPDWLIQLPQPTAKVIRAIVRQFEKAGTDGLEATELWHTPEIKELHGIAALKQGGNPAELLRKTKETLFVA